MSVETGFAIFLAIVVLILIIASIYISIDKSELQSSGSSIIGGGGGVTIIESDTNCSELGTSRPDITDLPCCIIGGAKSSLKYVDTLQGETYDMVVSPGEITWESVCSGFCSFTYDNQSKVCLDSLGNIDPLSTRQFERCKSQIFPDICVGLSKPIARTGRIAYYGYSATDSLCPLSNRTTC